jgi:hypothetical protein
MINRGLLLAGVLFCSASDQWAEEIGPLPQHHIAAAAAGSIAENFEVSPVEKV